MKMRNMGKFFLNYIHFHIFTAVQLGQYLKQEFRWQLRKKDQMKIESKLKVCRFIGELVKFNMFPKSEALFCLKQLLFDFAHHHIEMACTLLDTCGRFCLRSPEVSLHFYSYYYCNFTKFFRQINFIKKNS